MFFLGILGGCTAVSEPTATPQNDLPIATELPPTQVPTAESDNQPQSNNNGDADVVFVSARETESGVWTFTVTVRHADTGWEDYANGWDVVLPNGSVIITDSDARFTRLLLHPHEDEQPFTRSQSNIRIPQDVTTVTVRAHDLVDGYGGQEVVVDLTAVSGENFEIQR